MLKNFLNFDGVSINPSYISDIQFDGERVLVRINGNVDDVLIVNKEEWDRECGRLNATQDGPDYRAQLRQLTETINRLCMNIPHSIRIHP